MTYWIIAAMERTGLAWNVVHKTPASTANSSIEFPGEDEPFSENAA